MRKDLGASLSREPSLEQVLDALEPQRLYDSALLFPVTRRLISSEVKAVDTSIQDCYDPCFLLPLFSNLTAPGMLPHYTCMLAAILTLYMLTLRLISTFKFKSSVIHK